MSLPPWPLRRRYLECKNLQLIDSANSLLEMLEHLLSRARHCIHLEFYIFEDDSVGSRVADMLVRAAERGVSVYLLVDAFGSAKLSGPFVDRLRAGGVHFQWYQPLLPWKKKWGWGRRLHRKVVVIDHEYAIVGGINISQVHWSSQWQKGWLDYAVYFEGPACRLVHQYCEKTWNRSGLPFHHPEKIETTSIVPAHGDPNDARIESRILPVVNHWWRGRRQIYQSYLKAIAQAEKSVYIACAYFLPNKNIRTELKKSAQRGVSVKLLFGGTSDVPIVRWAMRYLYGFLLKSGIEIFEWQPNHVHAKIAVIDRRWATVGSFNLDDLSIYGNLELNVNILDSAFCSELEGRLETIMAEECVQITRHTWSERAWYMHLVDGIAYHSMRLIVRLPLFNIMNR